jgi:hypothetical protein
VPTGTIRLHSPEQINLTRPVEQQGRGTPTASTVAPSKPITIQPAETINLPEGTETVSSPEGAPDLPPLDKATMNAMLHAHVQGLDIPAYEGLLKTRNKKVMYRQMMPASPPGARAPGLLSALADEEGTPYENLGPVEMRHLYNRLANMDFSKYKFVQKAQKALEGKRMGGPLRDIERRAFDRNVALRALRSS